MTEAFEDEHPQFFIGFHGPNIDGSRLDARRVFPTIITFEDLLTRANYLTYGTSTYIRFYIKYYEEGSIDVAIEAAIYAKDILASSATFFDAGKWFDHFIQLFELVASTYGLIEFIKKCRGKKIQKITDLDEETVEVRCGGERYTLPRRVYNALLDYMARKYLQRLAETVREADFDKVDFRRRKDETPKAEIRWQDVDQFKAPEELMEIEEYREQVTLEVASVSFRASNKWRFKKDEKIFPAAIIDSHFLQRVNEGQENFRAGDMLECELVTKISHTFQGKSYEYRVEKVYRHFYPPDQMEMPF